MTPAATMTIEPTTPTTPEPAPPGPNGTPFRSLGAVAAGWAVLFVLGQLLLGVLASALPSDIPSVEGTVPTPRGLALFLLLGSANGVVAGLLTARLAGFAPVVHASALAAWIGFSAMMSSDAAQGLPFWFALGRVVTPALPIVLGGVLGKRLEARRTARAGTPRGV